MGACYNAELYLTPFTLSTAIQHRLHKVLSSCPRRSTDIVKTGFYIISVALPVDLHGTCASSVSIRPSIHIQSNHDFIPFHIHKNKYI